MKKKKPSLKKSAFISVLVFSILNHNYLWASAPTNPSAKATTYQVSGLEHFVDLTPFDPWWESWPTEGLPSPIRPSEQGKQKENGVVDNEGAGHEPGHDHEHHDHDLKNLIQSPLFIPGLLILMGFIKFVYQSYQKNKEKNHHRSDHSHSEQDHSTRAKHDSHGEHASHDPSPESHHHHHEPPVFLLSPEQALQMIRQELPLLAEIKKRWAGADERIVSENELPRLSNLHKALERVLEAQVEQLQNLSPQEASSNPLLQRLLKSTTKAPSFVWKQINLITDWVAWGFTGAFRLIRTPDARQTSRQALRDLIKFSRHSYTRLRADRTSGSQWGHITASALVITAVTFYAIFEVLDNLVEHISCQNQITFVLTQLAMGTVLFTSDAWHDLRAVEDVTLWQKVSRVTSVYWQALKEQSGWLFHEARSPINDQAHEWSHDSTVLAELSRALVREKLVGESESSLSSYRTLQILNSQISHLLALVAQANLVDSQTLADLFQKLGRTQRLLRQGRLQLVRNGAGWARMMPRELTDLLGALEKLDEKQGKSAGQSQALRCTLLLPPAS